MSAINRNGVKARLFIARTHAVKVIFLLSITCTVYSSVMQLGFALTAIDHLAKLGLGLHGSALGSTHCLH